MNDCTLSVEATVDRLKHDKSLIREPVTAPVEENVPPMVFACSFDEHAATSDEMRALLLDCPDDVKRFWNVARAAKLFEDVTFGQWGLEILAPVAAVEQTKCFQTYRSRDAVYGDLIIGRFLGDSDLLLVRCDQHTNDFGTVIVVAPIDPRPDWDVVAKTFGEFLHRYAIARGDMYWTSHVSDK